jgi:hypothetical protein
VEIRIGIINSPRELSIESDATQVDVQATVEAGLSSDAKLVSLSDAKGKRYLIPAASIAYIEIGETATRKVGFVN